MKSKNFLIFLALELFAIVWAGAVFSIFESRLAAGFAAGVYFVFVGMFITIQIGRSDDPWRIYTLYPALVHTFVISIPMMMMRFTSWALAFEEVKIWGIPGPIFHQISTGVFGVLIVATVVDYWRLKQRRID